MLKVILDPGHGGSDVGEYFNKRSEKNDNLRLALRIGQFLEDSGIEVAYTRTSDIYLPQLERVAIANQIGGDLLVSLHRLSGNAFIGKPSLDFFVTEDDPLGETAAKNIGDSLYDSGYKNYGVLVRTDIPILNDTDMPAIMVGIGYIRSEEENRYFDNNFVSIAEGIATGIENTLREQEEDEEVLAATNNKSKNYRYRIMVGPYRSYNIAQEHQMNLLNYGIRTEVEQQGNNYVIYLGNFNNLDDAALFERKLRSEGYRTIIIIA